MGSRARRSPRPSFSARQETLLSNDRPRCDKADMDTGITQTDTIAGADFTEPTRSPTQDRLDKGGAFTGLVGRCGLSPSDVAQVEALAEAVRRADGVGLKLNLPRQVVADPTGPRAPDQVSDLCYYEGGRLVGYAPLDGADELEVTAAVLPSHRWRGIFRLLMDSARREANVRGVDRLLLVSYPTSLSGVAAVKAVGLPYVSSEYRMEAEADGLPPLDAERVRLIQANQTNMTELTRLMGLTFGGRGSADALTERLQETGARYFIAEANAFSKCDLRGQVSRRRPRSEYLEMQAWNQTLAQVTF